MPDFGEETLGAIYLIFAPLAAIFGCGIYSELLWNN